MYELLGKASESMECNLDVTRVCMERRGQDRRVIYVLCTKPVHPFAVGPNFWNISLICKTLRKLPESWTSNVPVPRIDRRRIWETWHRCCATLWRARWYKCDHRLTIHNEVGAPPNGIEHDVQAASWDSPYREDLKPRAVSLEGFTYSK